MENTKNIAKEAVQCAGNAVAGLMWVADCLEQGGDARRAAAVRVMTQEIDDQLGQLLSLVRN